MRGLSCCKHKRCSTIIRYMYYERQVIHKMVYWTGHYRYKCITWIEISSGEIIRQYMLLTGLKQGLMRLVYVQGQDYIIELTGCSTMPIIIRKLAHKQFLLQPNIFLYQIWIFVEQKKTPSKSKVLHWSCQGKRLKSFRHKSRWTTKTL